MGSERAVPELSLPNPFPRCGTYSPLSLALVVSPTASAQDDAPGRDGQHDFDSEIGAWQTHPSRLQRPLTGPTEWVEYDGTAAVREVWAGR